MYDGLSICEFSLGGGGGGRLMSFARIIFSIACLKIKWVCPNYFLHCLPENQVVLPELFSPLLA